MASGGARPVATASPTNDSPSATREARATRSEPKRSFMLPPAVTPKAAAIPHIDTVAPIPPAPKPSTPIR